MNLDGRSWNTVCHIRQGTFSREYSRRKTQTQWFAFDIHLSYFYPGTYHISVEARSILTTFLDHSLLAVYPLPLTASSKTSCCFICQMEFDKSKVQGQGRPCSTSHLDKLESNFTEHAGIRKTNHSELSRSCCNLLSL